MLGTLLTLLAAQALPAAPPQLPAEPAHRGLQQIFIAPSGEAFRAAAEAPYPMADWFARADTDHDGKLTQGEFDADFLRFFASLDLDHDGVINGVELDRYETELAPELHTSSYDGGWGQKSSGDGESKPANALGSFMADAPQGAGRFDLLRIPEPVAAMDTALNGRINHQEAEDAADYRFTLLDAKHRGYLLLAELPESWAQHHRVDDEKRGHGGGKRGARGGGGRRGNGGGGFGGAGAGSMGGGMGGGTSSGSAGGFDN